jgi:pimeloyl-ACP methyl ester carboxylesterase
MSTFILVHGSWHGGWCWELVTERLTRLGHVAVAPDLRSLGEDDAPPSSVTLDDWTAQIESAVRAAGEPVALVGHSRGGIVVSSVAERVPELVAASIYVCAFLIPNGVPMVQVAMTDTESRLLPHLRIDEANGQVTVDPEHHREIFYSSSPEPLAAGASARLKPEPLAPLATPLELSAERYGRVPRAYIVTLRDQTLGPALQRRMIDTEGVRRVIEFDTDHSPFYSAPDELVEGLLSLTGDDRLVSAPA